MSRVKTQITLAAAGVVFLGGSTFGAQLLTKKADAQSNASDCDSRTVKSGQNVTNNLVTVNVYNASQRSGLANRVTINLQRSGFLGGKIGNASDLLDKGLAGHTVTIVTIDKTDPEVQLVARQFKDKVSYATPKTEPEAGVTVVIGDDYSGLAKKPPRAVRSDRTITFCLPVVTVN